MSDEAIWFTIYVINVALMVFTVIPRQIEELKQANGTRMTKRLLLFFGLVWTFSVAMIALLYYQLMTEVLFFSLTYIRYIVSISLLAGTVWYVILYNARR